ncbi:MAG: ABC transporter ATP-binding protein [SAR324 cluster bacterium]|nr:ABC transporter ATP-binding protein [SAR324 cluster bacterium]
MKNKADEVFLQVKGLRTHFYTDEGVVKAVDGADFQVRRGKTLCIVGESGCGKSITARSILQLLTRIGKIVEGQILLQRDSGEVLDLAELKPQSKVMQSIRGKEISMIFQEPMSSLSPVHTIGNQIMEAIQLHFDVKKKEAKKRAIDILQKVGIPKAETRLGSYVFELSGGMRQRAMIAMALSCQPRLLIADEPTTALDVTTQANILDLIRELQKDMEMTIIFITHDLGVVAEIADEVVVMYLGKAVESGDVDTIFHDPKHPYTRELLQSIPKLGSIERGRLQPIPGMVPHPFARPKGCDFHPRCESFLKGTCDQIEPSAIRLSENSHVRCLLYGGKEKE